MKLNLKTLVKNHGKNISLEECIKCSKKCCGISGKINIQCNLCASTTNYRILKEDYYKYGEYACIKCKKIYEYEKNLKEVVDVTKLSCKECYDNDFIEKECDQNDLKIFYKFTNPYKYDK